jgi:hypothetical protein
MITVEIRGFGKGGAQVFRAETESEMIGVLREAQRNATRKLRDQALLLRIMTELFLQYSGKSTNFLSAEIAKRLKAES